MERNTLGRISRGTVATLTMLAVVSCSDVGRENAASMVSGPASLLASRQGAVDTSRLIEKFRRNGGGGVFIKLTGEPTNAALTALVSAGVRGPRGSTQLITFDSLRIATVAGYLSAGVVKAIAALPWVERIESSQDIDVIGPASTPSVNSYASDIKWNLNMVRAPDMWRVFDATGESPNGSQSVGISVLDVGGDYRLSNYASNWQYWAAFSMGNYTTDPTEVYEGQHGTDVGSFAVGEPDGLWGVGVAPRAFVSFYKVLPSTDDWIPIVQGLNQAYANGYAVINMSIGNCGEVPPQAMADAIAQFASRVPADAAYPGVGVSLVASAGNGLYSANNCTNTRVTYPGAYPGVIAVAAVDENRTRGSYPDLSSGSKIELSAPGICVDGLLVGGGDHYCITGTSFAAPHVAGAIAAIRAKNPSWSASYVRSRLTATAVKVPGQNLPNDVRFGYGIVNPYEVLSNITVGITGITTVKTPNNYTWTCSAGGGSGGFSYSWERSDAGGTYYPVGSGSSYASWTDQSNSPYFDLRCIATSVSQETGSAVKRVNIIIP